MGAWFTHPYLITRVVWLWAGCLTFLGLSKPCKEPGSRPGAQGCCVCYCCCRRCCLGRASDGGGTSLRLPLGFLWRLPHSLALAVSLSGRTRQAALRGQPSLRPCGASSLSISGFGTEKEGWGFGIEHPVTYQPWDLGQEIFCQFCPL